MYEDIRTGPHLFSGFSYPYLNQGGRLFPPQYYKPPLDFQTLRRPWTVDTILDVHGLGNKKVPTFLPKSNKDCTRCKYIVPIISRDKHEPKHILGYISDSVQVTDNYALHLK